MRRRCTYSSKSPPDRPAPIESTKFSAAILSSAMNGGHRGAIQSENQILLYRTDGKLYTVNGLSSHLWCLK